MTKHKTGTREDWLAARIELLKAEKKLTRRSDELARRRQELPWVQIDKEYRFEGDDGSATLTDLSVVTANLTSMLSISSMSPELSLQWPIAARDASSRK